MALSLRARRDEMIQELVASLQPLASSASQLSEAERIERTKPFMDILLDAFEHGDMAQLRAAATQLMARRPAADGRFVHVTAVQLTVRRLLARAARAAASSAEEALDAVERVHEILDEVSFLAGRALTERMEADAAERARAEQALRESEERYRRIFELAPVAIVVHRQGRVIFANPAAAHLHGAEDGASLIGRAVVDYLDPGDRAGTIARLRAAATLGNDARAIEETFLRLDGTAFTAEVVARPILFEGEPAVQVIYVDVSSRKEAEEARRRAEAQEQVIRAQEELLLSLSAPLIPLGEGILVMPLVGRITVERAGRLVEALTQGVAANGARAAILDVTGVPEADNTVAQALARAAQAIRLLGAEVVLTGIQPAMARAVVEMGLDLGGVATRATLREGIEHARRRR